ncbi:MAG: tol-pal system protein YbgF [Ectothiorhodospiraceae bacterium]|nr:tol-pal system protein YbgF [Ectothiorhodospiraceae bacterium]MCH8506451.1 tol-pal system protein YbgF [Ectothiorhodospiraceae bacterium]
MSLSTGTWKQGLLTLALSTALLAQPAMADVERRLDRIERLLDGSTLMDMSRLQERLRDEVANLRGDIDVLQREVQELQRQQRSLYEDLDSRLQAMEHGQAGNGPERQPSLPDTPGLDADLAAGDDATDIPDDAPDAEPESDAAEDYEQAFELLREGRYEAAGNAFREVLENHSGTLYADNALYWLGESYYVVRDFDSAMEHFEAVIADEDNNKRPDALLKKGFIHYERSQWQDARRALEEARDAYPNSSVATLAENRLRRMRDEGR